jgi:D-3-phosphoglycerate dehydrogenase
VSARAELRILNVEPAGYCAEARRVLAQCGTVVERELSRAELLAQLASYDVLIVRLAHQIDREVIDAGPRLRAIVSATTGLDHIDVATARSRGIDVLSLRGETDFLRGVRATAEHTWALLLALQRRIVPAAVAVRGGQWDRDALRGHDLDGKRLGIVGLGRIGRMVAGYGRSFGMEVAAHDPDAVEWPPDVKRHARLDDLLAQSDVLTLHVPLDERSKGCIGREQLALLPRGAVLVNTSRGEVVDEDALLEALESGTLAGAALDVVAHERRPEQRSRSPLLAYAATHDELLVTPHIGGATFESMEKTEVFMARKLLDLVGSPRAEVSG